MPSGIRMHERHRYYTDLLNTISPVKIRYAQYIFNQHLTITDKKHLIQICDEAYCAMDENTYLITLNFTVSDGLAKLISLLGYDIEVYDVSTVIELM
jgi:hypothetical protein